MKTVQTLDDARRLALSNGAELTVGAQRFNTARAVVPAASAQRAPRAAAVAAPVAEFTRDDVRRMIAEATAPLHEQIARLTAAQASNKTKSASPPAQWDFDIVENSEGAIVHVTARAKA